MKFDTIEYSVCVDCLIYVANGDVPEDRREQEFLEAIERETEGKEGASFACGVQPTEDDPDGIGHKEFSHHPCELCRLHLAGSRHGLTLLIPLPKEASDG